jgi:hypothetical protein
MERGLTLNNRELSCCTLGKEQKNAHNTSQRGVAIIFALFALSAIATLALSVTKNAIAYTYLNRGLNDALNLSATLRMLITPPTSQIKRGCQEQTVSGIDIAGIKTPSQLISVCTNGKEPFTSNQKNFTLHSAPDFSTLLRAASICPEQRSKTTQTRFYAPYATYSCLYTKTPIQGAISLDNIIGNNLQIDDGATEVTTLIATPGSLELSGALLLFTDTVIATGGDIKIPKVQMRTESSLSNITLTVISAHGDISIGELRGDIRLLAYSRRLLSVPPSGLPDRVILPILRADSISGVIGAS